MVCCGAAPVTLVLPPFHLDCERKGMQLFWRGVQHISVPADEEALSSIKWQARAMITVKHEALRL